MNTGQLYKEFSAPSNRFRPIPLFRVNDEVDPKEIRWQIRSLKEQGCGGVFSICECFNEGAPQKFLSDWWWQVVRWLAEACAKEGLEFWVYDDEDWPSGSVGGQLLEKHPELRWKYLCPVEHEFRGPTVVELDTGDELFVAAVAFQKQGKKIRRESLTDLTAEVRDKKLRWEVPSGRWTIALYSAPVGKGFFLDAYGDLMDKRLGATFVDWVYNGHYQRLKSVPGVHLVGYFTDEPAISLSMIQWGERFSWYPSMPFTPALPEVFRQRHGYDCHTHLPLLYYDAGPESLRFRCHYWETCCHLYSENYFGQIYRFCDEHGLLSSGHLVVEENFLNHLAQQGGNLPTHFRHMHIPGVDWIHPFETYWPATTPKYATSMAHLAGRERTWCETFAASGWGLTFQEMRWIVNWEHVHGINMQIPITYKYSMRGAKRTKFYPGAITYQQPYWDHFRGFADYEARVCALASGGGHVAQIALAYPSVDIWAHCWEHRLLEERSEEYNRLGDRIRSLGYDFDILDDQALVEQSRVVHGRLCTPTETFEVLLMPRAEAMRRETLKRCQELAQDGGSIIFLGTLARHSFESGANDPELSQIMKSLLGASCYRAASKGQRFWRKCGKGRVGFAPEMGDVLHMLRETIPPDVTASPDEGQLFAYHRRLEDGHLYLLYHRSQEKRTLEVTLSAGGFPERWNPETGKIEPVETYSTTPRGTRLKLTFHPHELIPIVLRPELSPASHPTEPLQVVQEIPVQKPFRFWIEETMNRPHVSWNFTQAQDGWKSASPAMSVPSEIPVGDWSQFGLATFSGLGHYETEVDFGTLRPGSQVILCLGRVAVSAEVRLNGKSAGFVFFEPYQIDITELAQSGANRLEIIVANTLSNYFSQFVELAGEPLSAGGDKPERRVSGLIGPVVVRVMGRS